MIIWSGPTGDPSGYGTAGREYVKCLFNAGAQIFTLPFNHYRGKMDNVLSREDAEFFSSTCLKVPSGADLSHSILVRHATPNAAFVPELEGYYVNARKSFLYSVWETNCIPKEYSKYVKAFNGGVITASKVSKDAFTAAVPDLQVHIVPHVIHNYLSTSLDTNHIKFPVNKVIERLLSYKEKGRTIYFANLEWHQGKGYDVLIKGFLEAFKGREDVVLLLKTYNLFSINNSYKASVINYIKGIKSEIGSPYPSIIPVVGNMNWDELRNFYGVSDCYLSMSRREGFGLTMSEALGHGLPIICPDKGGHREFLNKTNSIQIKSSWKPVVELEAERSPYAGQQWIEPDFEDFKSKLKLFQDKLRCDNEQKKVWDTCIKQTLNKFSPDSIAIQLMSLFAKE